MSQTPPEEPTTYATPADVLVALGKLADRLPATINVEARLPMAHAEVLDRILAVYPALPTWRPPAREALRWAEAKIAAADILDITRASRDDASLVADKMRASAYATLSSPLPGQPLGDDGSPHTPPAAPVPTLPLSNGGPSNFASPYDATPYVPAYVWGAGW